MLFSITYSLVDCSHYSVVFYFTNWQVLAVFSYSFFSLLSVSLIRFYWFRRDEDRYEGFTKEILAFNSKYFVVVITWHLHGIAFCYTVWVFLLYWIGGADDITLTTVSIFSHLVPTVLMLVDFFVSGIAWPLTMVRVTWIYALAYFSFSYIHFRLKLGHLDLGTCNYNTDPPYYVYEQVDWRDKSTYALAAASVFFLVPTFTVGVWFASHSVVWLEQKYLCRGYRGGN